MKRWICVMSITAVTAISLLNGCAAQQATVASNSETELREQLKDSLVFVKVAAYQYEQLQPWKTPDLIERSGYGCAVGTDLALTTAWNVSDAAFIKIQRHGQNETIPAKVKVIDYESNLCLLQLEMAEGAAPLKPIRFENSYRKGAEVKTFWLSPDGSISSARGFLDRAEVFQSVPSFASSLNYVVGNASKAFGRGRIYCINDEPIGMACWSNNDTGEVGLIPAETIQAFLADAADDDYDGFGVEGFETTALLDPTLRASLKMPAELKDGVYVAKVRGMGTGSDLLRGGDAILSIDGQPLDAHGKYEDSRYEQLEYQHLISRHKAGDEVKFTLWREGQQVEVVCKAVGINAAEMLVPWYEYGNQPEYIVLGGYVIQKLTRDYLEMWGEGWEGKTPPHLFHYLHDKAFEPTDSRQQIVVLSYVLPAEINLGYHMLGRLVVRKVNGVEVRNLSEVIGILAANTSSPFHTLEFEQENPTIVIPREALPMADQRIAQQYGIPKLVNVRETKDDSGSK
ncbi:MAG: PDZ domain-containing protein [Phycisphaerae bacterium]|nr:PDZ domain-containing protein [Phycisphaerae bacterium]